MKILLKSFKPLLSLSLIFLSAFNYQSDDQTVSIEVYEIVNNKKRPLADVCLTIDNMPIDSCTNESGKVSFGNFEKIEKFDLRLLKDGYGEILIRDFEINKGEDNQYTFTMRRKSVIDCYEE